MDGILISVHSELFYHVIYSPIIRLSDYQPNIYDPPPKNIPFVPENGKDLGVLRPIQNTRRKIGQNRKCFLKLYPFIIISNTSQTPTKNDS
jgi:hypothetical protein